MYDMTADPQEMRNVYDDPAYADKRTQMHRILEQVQQEYEDTDPCEKELILFKGDRRLFDRGESSTTK